MALAIVTCKASANSRLVISQVPRAPAASAMRSTVLSDRPEARAAWAWAGVYVGSASCAAFLSAASALDLASSRLAPMP